MARLERSATLAALPDVLSHFSETDAHVSQTVARIPISVGAQRLSLSPAERAVARLLPSVGDVLFAVLLVGGTLVLQGKILGIDGDVGWNLRIGLETLARGLPRTEVSLSGLQGQPAVHWQWLAQAAYALAYQLAGLNGVVALASLLIAMVGSLLFAAIRRRGLALAPALLLTLAGMSLVVVTWTARAQLFSLVLTLIWTEIIWRYWRDGKSRWLAALPPLMALWANLHGGFLGGLGILTLATAVAWLFPRSRGAAQPRQLSVTLAISTLATFGTPWGLALYTHILTYARNPLVGQYTQEYQSPDFHEFYAWVFAGLAAALLALWAARRRVRSSPLAVALALVWTGLGFSAVRFIPLWSVIVVPLLAEVLASQRLPTMRPRVDGLIRRLSLRLARFEGIERLAARGLWSSLAGLALLVLLLNNGATPGSPLPILRAEFDTHTFPVSAVRALRETGLPPGRGLNTYDWGGYLDFALPQDAVFVDSRSDVYSERRLRDYLTIMDLSPGWRRLLDQYQIAWALLPADKPLAQVLAREPGWACRPIGSGGVAALCIR